MARLTLVLLLALCFGTMVHADLGRRALLKKGADDNPGTSTTLPGSSTTPPPGTSVDDKGGLRSSPLPGTSTDDKGGLNGGGGSSGGGNKIKSRTGTTIAYTGAGSTCNVFASSGSQAAWAEVVGQLAKIPAAEVASSVSVACSPSLSDDAAKQGLQISISFTKDLTRKQLKKLRNKVNNAIENGSFTNKLGLLGKTDFIPTHA